MSNEGRRGRAQIPALTAIKDAVSYAVRDQYEQMPYPRWATAALPGPPMRIDQHLRRPRATAAAWPQWPARRAGRGVRHRRGSRSRWRAAMPTPTCWRSISTSPASPLRGV